MTVHVLSAGDGYAYLTRQVASADTRRGGLDLAGYYAASGYPPGRWMGAGLAGLAGGSGLSGAVDTAQMARLFGVGEDPVTGNPLGARYRLPTPTGSRRRTRSVAGFDCVFTPAKSVSVLWALGDDHVRRQVLAAHRAAVAATLRYMEREVARTRAGAGGLAQLDTRGLVAAAFDHWDARPVADPTGVHTDPNLHTHLVLANRVQGPDGRWRTLDSKALHHGAVACSERYSSSPTN